MSSLRFGECTLDLDARQLFRRGRPQHLSPKAFELLKILVDERPKAVAKADLHERIWPGTFVTDDSLAQLVGEVRAAIADSARHPRFLRTVYSFGYAFASIPPREGDTDPPTSVEPAFWLVLEGHAILLPDGEHVIGRDPAARITLDSVRVSRRHARIVVKSAVATLEDLGSRNGTSLNGAPITTAVTMTDGDEIAIGGFALKFRTAASAPPTEADE